MTITGKCPHIGDTAACNCFSGYSVTLPTSSSPTWRYTKYLQSLRLLRARTRGHITKRELDQELAALESKEPLPEREER